MEYKIKQLQLMLEIEKSPDPEVSGYGAHLSHWHGKAKAIQLDAGAIQALINYYTACEELEAAKWYRDQEAALGFTESASKVQADIDEMEARLTPARCCMCSKPITGVVWGCEECRDIFCNQCFREQHGEDDFVSMQDTGPVLCAVCRAEAVTDC